MNMTMLFLLADAATEHRLIVTTGIGLGLVVLMVVAHLIYQSGFWKGIERGQSEGKQFHLGRPMAVGNLQRGCVYSALANTSVRVGDVEKHFALLADAKGDVFLVELPAPLRENEGNNFFCVIAHQSENETERYSLEPCVMLEEVPR